MDNFIISSYCFLTKWTWQGSFKQVFFLSQLWKPEALFGIIGRYQAVSRATCPPEPLGERICPSLLPAPTRLLMALTLHPGRPNSASLCGDIAMTLLLCGLPFSQASGTFRSVISSWLVSAGP